MMKLILIILVSFTITNIYAQKGAGENVYTLEKCIETALNNNYDIKLAEARKLSSEADVKSAFGEFLPSLGINSNYRRTLDKTSYVQVGGQLFPITNFNPNNYGLSAGGEWLIFDGFGRENNYRRAHELFNSLEINAEHTRNRIELTIYQDYTDVIAKAQIVKLRKENLALGKKDLERIKAQSSAGVIPIDIVYSQEADLGNKEFDLVSSENDYNSAKAVLLVSMGLSPDIEAEFLENSLPSSMNLAEINEFKNSLGTFSEATNKAFNERQDYKAYQLNVKASEFRLDASYSSYYPSLSFSGGWGWTYNELTNFSELGSTYVGVNISIPIFDKFRTNLLIQNAQFQLDQARIEQKQLEQNIISTIKVAFLRLEASEKQLEISERALKSAEMNNESLKEKFRVGTTSIADYLNANNQLIKAQINRVNAVYQYFRTQKEILYSVGKL